MTRPTEHAPTLRRRSLLLAGVAASAGAAPWVAAQAQAYPSRPITLIIPWPAGGSTDRHLRTHVGIITRCNPKTASIDTGDGYSWSVTYGALRHVLDV